MYRHDVNKSDVLARYEFPKFSEGDVSQPTPPNTACAFFKSFALRGFGFILLSNLVHARPPGLITLAKGSAGVLRDTPEGAERKPLARTCKLKDVLCKVPREQFRLFYTSSSYRV